MIRRCEVFLLLFSRGLRAPSGCGVTEGNAFRGRRRISHKKRYGHKRHAALCCLAQSILWEQEPAGQISERFLWADGHSSLGQRSSGLIRHVFAGILEFARNLWLTHKSNSDIVALLLPA